MALKVVCRFAPQSCWDVELDVDVTAEMVVAKLTFRLREDLDVVAEFTERRCCRGAGESRPGATSRDG